MLRSMTAKQFHEWWCYAGIDPFTEKRQDYRVASIVQLLYNIHRGQKQAAISLEDALLQFGEEPEERQPAKQQKQTWQEQLLIAKMWTMAMEANPIEMS